MNDKPVGPNVSELPDIYASQTADKASRGRFTIREAAEFLSQEGRVRVEDMEAALIEAVKKGLLYTYELGHDQKYQSETVRSFYEELHWDDLNRWLSEHQPRIAWRFPAPVSASSLKNEEVSGGQSSPRTARRRADAISADIEAAIEEIGVDWTADGVMRKLISWAGKAGTSIISQAGSEVIWRGANGKEGKLTMSALKKRLDRRSSR